MEQFKLKSIYRQTSGKGVARKLRADGKIPSVLYGLKEDAVSLSIDEQEFRRVLRTYGETAIVDLDIEGLAEKEYNAIVKDVQVHPVTGRILHVDFQQIRRGEKLKIEVQVHNPSSSPAGALVDLRVHFVKANGSTSPKVFKGAELDIAPGETGLVRKSVSVAQHSTRTHYPGEHQVEILINGASHPAGSFTLSV